MRINPKEPVGCAPRTRWADPTHRPRAQCAPYARYVHINPQKHGLVARVEQWPHSTFHRLVAAGIYPADWAGGSEDMVEAPD